MIVAGLCIDLQRSENQYLFLNTYNGFISKINKVMKEILVSGQLPPYENCSLVRVGVWTKVRVSFRVGGQPDNWP